MKLILVKVLKVYHLFARPAHFAAQDFEANNNQKHAYLCMYDVWKYNKNTASIVVLSRKSHVLPVHTHETYFLLTCAKWMSHVVCAIQASTS